MTSTARARAAASILACLVALALPSTAGALEPIGLPKLTGPVAQLPALGDAVPDVPALPSLPSLSLPASTKGGPLAMLPLLGALEYRWVTTYGPAGQTGMRREHIGVIGVPTPIDVGGASGPDILAELSLSGTQQITMKVTKLPLAEANMPLAIEAVVADPRAGANSTAAFGYDARDTIAPQSFTAVIGVSGQQNATTLAVQLGISGAGKTLAIIGQTFRPGAAGERLDPKRVRMTLGPVPASARLTALVGSGGAAQRSTLELQSASPSLVSLRAEDVQGETERAFAATIDHLSGTMSLGLTDEGGRRRVSYDSTATVARLSGSLVERRGGAIVREAALDLTGVPTRIDLVQDSPDRATLNASAPIGGLSAAISRGGPARRLPDAAYVHTYRDASLDSIALRVLGLSRAEIGAGEPLVVDALLQPGRFRALLEAGARRIDARVHDLPSRVRLTFSPATRRATYEGAVPIAEVLVDGHDPNGLAGRAKTLRLLLRGVPTGLDASFGQEGQGAGVNARGKVLGLVEALVTSGPVESLPAGEDGLILRDLPDRYLVAARITNLRHVAATQVPVPGFVLDTTGGRPLRVSLRQQRPNAPDQIADARVDRLAPATRVRVFETQAGRRLSWTAGAPTGEITIAGQNLPLSGRARNLQVTLRDLPTAVEVGMGREGGGADIDAGGRTIGLIAAQLTSGPTEWLDPALDALVLRDVHDRYVLAARLTGLRKASVVQVPLPDVTLETTARRRLRVDVNQREASGGKVVYTRALLDHLLASTRIRLMETAAGKRLIYNASGPANSLSFDTNDGDRWNLHGDLAGPLPAAFELCQADDSSCGGSGRHADGGSMRVTASQHTTLNIFDCRRPLNANCNSAATAAEFTRARQLRVRHFVQDGHFSDFGERGHIYVDTDGHDLSGWADVKDASVGFDAYFPAGFRSNDRLGSWTFWGISKSKRGWIACPSGTNLGVRILGFRLGVTNYLC